MRIWRMFKNLFDFEKKILMFVGISDFLKKLGISIFFVGIN